MANELNTQQSANSTGLTVTARILNAAGVAQGSDRACAEIVAQPGYYSGDVGTLAAGRYFIVFYENGDVIDSGTLLWDGSKEIGILDVPRQPYIE